MRGKTRKIHRRRKPNKKKVKSRRRLRKGGAGPPYTTHLVFDFDGTLTTTHLFGLFNYLGGCTFSTTNGIKENFYLHCKTSNEQTKFIDNLQSIQKTFIANNHFVTTDLNDPVHRESLKNNEVAMFKKIEQNFLDSQDNPSIEDTTSQYARDKYLTYLKWNFGSSERHNTRFDELKNMLDILHNLRGVKLHISTKNSRLFVIYILKLVGLIDFFKYDDTGKFENISGRYGVEDVDPPLLEKNVYLTSLLKENASNKVYFFDDDAQEIIDLLTNVALVKTASADELFDEYCIDCKTDTGNNFMVYNKLLLPKADVRLEALSTRLVETNSGIQEKDMPRIIKYFTDLVAAARAPFVAASPVIPQRLINNGPAKPPLTPIGTSNPIYEIVGNGYQKFIHNLPSDPKIEIKLNVLIPDGGDNNDDQNEIIENKVLLNAKNVTITGNLNKNIAAYKSECNEDTINNHFKDLLEKPAILTTSNNFAIVNPTCILAIMNAFNLPKQTAILPKNIGPADIVQLNFNEDVTRIKMFHLKKLDNYVCNSAKTTILEKNFYLMCIPDSLALESPIVDDLSKYASNFKKSNNMLSKTFTFWSSYNIEHLLFTAAFAKGFFTHEYATAAAPPPFIPPAKPGYLGVAPNYYDVVHPPKQKAYDQPNATNESEYAEVGPIIHYGNPGDVQNFVRPPLIQEECKELRYDKVCEKKNEAIYLDQLKALIKDDTSPVKLVLVDYCATQISMLNRLTNSYPSVSSKGLVNMEETMKVSIIPTNLKEKKYKDGKGQLARFYEGRHEPRLFVQNLLNTKQLKDMFYIYGNYREINPSNFCLMTNISFIRGFFEEILKQFRVDNPKTFLKTLNLEETRGFHLFHVLVKFSNDDQKINVIIKNLEQKEIVNVSRPMSLTSTFQFNLFLMNNCESCNQLLSLNKKNLNLLTKSQLDTDKCLIKSIKCILTTTLIKYYYNFMDSICPIKYISFGSSVNNRDIVSAIVFMKGLFREFFNQFNASNNLQIGNIKEIFEKVESNMYQSPNYFNNKNLTPLNSFAARKWYILSNPNNVNNNYFNHDYYVVTKFNNKYSEKYYLTILETYIDDKKKQRPIRPYVFHNYAIVSSKKYQYYFHPNTNIYASTVHGLVQMYLPGLRKYFASKPRLNGGGVTKRRPKKN